LEVFTGLIKTLKLNVARMQQVMSGSYVLATDLADYLVRKGLPFRQAHDIVGKLVKYAISKNKGFHELSLNEYRNFSPLFADDVYGITVETSVAARSSAGGTAPKQVAAALSRARKLVRVRNEK
jgi:argininosuccinate lyase